MFAVMDYYGNQQPPAPAGLSPVFADDNASASASRRRHTWKKVFLTVLSLLMATSLTTSATVLPPKRSANVPIVLVHGMAGTPLYRDPDSEDPQPVGGMEAKAVLSILRDHPNLFSYVAKLASRNTLESMEQWDELLDSIQAFAKTADSNCSPDGGPNGIGVINAWTDPLSEHPEYFDYDNGVTRIARELCDEAGAENVYAYNYDWRLDLYESGAVGLDHFIQAVRKQTGAEKIALVCDSLGGATVSCYLDAHKDDGVLDRVVIVNGAIEGVDCASAYTENLYVDPDEVTAYLKRLGTSLNGGQLEPLFFALSGIFSGMLNTFSGNINSGLDENHIQERIFNDCFKPIFGYIPALWECVPYAYFDHAVDSMVKIGFLDTDSPLYEKISRYHEVQGRVEDNLKYVHDHGVQVAIIASYGYPGIPFTPNCSKQTDILIETEYESAGATVALCGQNLPRRAGKYKSADLQIDASTCALPDNTWFIKNLRHVNFLPGKPAMALIAGLCTGTYDCDLESVQKATGYGQFLLADSNQALTNITPNNTGEHETLIRIGNPGETGTTGTLSNLAARISGKFKASDR